MELNYHNQILRFANSPFKPGHRSPGEQTLNTLRFVAGQVKQYFEIRSESIDPPGRRADLHQPTTGPVILQQREIAGGGVSSFCHTPLLFRALSRWVPTYRRVEKAWTIEFCLEAPIENPNRLPHLTQQQLEQPFMEMGQHLTSTQIREENHV